MLSYLPSPLIAPAQYSEIPLGGFQNIGAALKKRFPITSLSTAPLLSSNANAAEQSAISAFLNGSLLHGTMNFMAALFIIAIGCAVLWVAALYVIDIRQTRHTIRRNYPVIGRFRYFFEHLGSFFRQYFYALDREELPFNRAQRSWVYRAAKGISSNVAFGSTRPFSPGDIHFVSAGFALLDEECQPTPIPVIGADCPHPYQPKSLVNISAMSFGALSAPAVQALSRGAAESGCWLNTGEGGYSEHHQLGQCDIVFQIGTAKYGVRDHDGQLCHSRLATLATDSCIKMFELKLSQGAKPGKGGILPAEKVTAEIAKTRGIPEGQASISPNRHTDIGSIDELLDRIAEIKATTGKPVGFKTVIGDPHWFQNICHAMVQRSPASLPDFVTIDSADGGTGASPQSLMDHMGLPLNESLPAVVDALTQVGLRNRIKVIASGKLITPSSAARALATGADFIASARGFMLALGCIQAMQCQNNTCPTGITTHDAKLQRGLDPTNKATRVARYCNNLNHEIEMIAHSCGVAHPGLLQRHHVRIIDATGRSQLMSEIYPALQPISSDNNDVSPVRILEQTS